MRIFAVDLGSNVVGWAYLDSMLRAGRELLSVGVWRLQTARTESPGVRWIRFTNRLDEVLSVSRLAVDLVAYEEVKNHTSSRMERGPDGKPRRRAMFNVAAAHAYGASQAHLLAWCERAGLAYASVTIADVKTAATGKGGGKGTAKEDVARMAGVRWPRHTFETFDASDAAFLALAAARNHDPSAPCTALSHLEGQWQKTRDPQQPTIFD